MRVRGLRGVQGATSMLAVLTIAALVVLVVPPRPAQALPEPVPPSCPQPSHPSQVDLAGCIYASELGSISGSAWTAHDPPQPQGMIVDATTGWCTSSHGTSDVCTSNASIRWIRVLQGNVPSSQPVFYQPALPGVVDPWQKLAACGITPESLPAENHLMARCYSVGEGNVALLEILPVVITADVTIRGVEQSAAQEMGGTVTGCLGSGGQQYCSVTQLVSVVGTVSPSATDFDPTAAFEFDVGSDRLVQFTNLSSDPEDSPEELTYLWSFDDGTTSTERHPDHQYDDPGTYSVTLQVTDTGGNTDSVVHEVQVATCRWS